MSQGKDNHADLGNAKTSTPQPSPNQRSVQENERDDAKRAHGQAGAGFEDEGDEYAHSDGAAYREAPSPKAPHTDKKSPAHPAKRS